MWLLPKKQASGANNSLLFAPLFYGAAMRLFELFEAKTDKKKVPATTPRNFVAKNAKTSGAGSHSDKKFNRKEKHKNTNSDE
jgi:hypothetical protein